MKDVYDMMTLEDLTPDMQILEEMIGLDVLRNILRHYAGLTFYIPKITRFDSLIRKYIKHFPEKPFKQIARELNVSEQFLKKYRK